MVCPWKDSEHHTENILFPFSVQHTAKCYIRIPVHLSTTGVFCRHELGEQCGSGSPSSYITYRCISIRTVYVNKAAVHCTRKYLGPRANGRSYTIDVRKRLKAGIHGGATSLSHATRMNIRKSSVIV